MSDEFDGSFDYETSAELFMMSVRGPRGRTSKYRRFETAAEAIRFAIEEMPEQLLIGIAMETSDRRFDHRDLRVLYHSNDYPLARSGDVAV